MQIFGLCPVGRPRLVSLVVTLPRPCVGHAVWSLLRQSIPSTVIVWDKQLETLGATRNAAWSATIEALELEDDDWIMTADDDDHFGAHHIESIRTAIRIAGTLWARRPDVVTPFEWVYLAPPELGPRVQRCHPAPGGLGPHSGTAIRVGAWRREGGYRPRARAEESHLLGAMRRSVVYSPGCSMVYRNDCGHHTGSGLADRSEVIPSGEWRPGPSSDAQWLDSLVDAAPSP